MLKDREDHQAIFKVKIDEITFLVLLNSLGTGDYSGRKIRFYVGIFLFPMGQHPVLPSDPKTKSLDEFLSLSSYLRHDNTVCKSKPIYLLLTFLMDVPKLGFRSRASYPRHDLRVCKRTIYLLLSHIFSGCAKTHFVTFSQLDTA